MQSQTIHLSSTLLRTITFTLLAVTVGCTSTQPPQAAPPEAFTIAQSVTPSPTQAQPASSSEPKAGANDTPAVSSTMALAMHLKQINAIMYGVHWCPYCNRQKQLFGEAISQINYIECDPQGQNPRLDLCKKAQISGYPTWEIKGKFYSGLHSLNELADLSGYQGDRNF